MNKKQITDLIEVIDNIINQIQLNSTENVYKETSLALPAMQQMIMVLLEYEILEQQVALMLLEDLVQSIEQRDEVLLLDVLKYGINSLLCEILRIMEDEENE